MRLIGTVLLSILLSLIFFSCVSTNNKPYESELAGVYHRVEQGDTLGKISRRYQVSQDEIMDINGIDDVRTLRVGQSLFIPSLDPISARIANLQKPKKASKPTVAKQGRATPSKGKVLDFPLPGGKIFRQFSRNKLNPYDGIGIKAKLGSKVVSAADGKVIFVGNDGTKFGLLVLVEHQAPFITVYTHLQRALVKTGQRVKRRSPIGLVGKSGGVSTPRLHFQVRVDQRPKDPRLYVKST